METEPPNAPEDPRQGRFLHVTPAQFVGSLVAALAVFFFATGPLWRHAGNITLLDSSIYWSYLVIPVAIAGCLLWSKRWSVRGFLLDTMALTLTKYVITASIAIGLWALHGDPEGLPPPPHTAKSAEPAPVITPTKIDPAQTGTLVVTVTRASGDPVEGALAYVAGGLEGYVFAPPEGPVELTNDGRGVMPAFAVAQTGQRIEGRSTDGELHTLVVRREGAALFNVPLLRSGAPTTVHAGDATGLATVRCNVHPSEAESRLLLVGNPFHASSDATGQVTLRGVPAGALRVAAIVAGMPAGEATVQLGAGKTMALRLGP